MWKRGFEYAQFTSEIKFGVVPRKEWSSDPENGSLVTLRYGVAVNAHGAPVAIPGNTEQNEAS